MENRGATARRGACEDEAESYIISLKIGLVFFLLPASAEKKRDNREPIGRVCAMPYQDYYSLSLLPLPRYMGEISA